MGQHKQNMTMLYAGSAWLPALTCAKKFVFTSEVCSRVEAEVAAIFLRDPEEA
jgi:hypothetical protein